MGSASKTLPTICRGGSEAKRRDLTDLTLVANVRRISAGAGVLGSPLFGHAETHEQRLGPAMAFLRPEVGDAGLAAVTTASRRQRGLIDCDALSPHIGTISLV